MVTIRQFLKDIGYYYVVPPVDPVDAILSFADLEQILEHQLPMEYREFIVTYGGIALDGYVEFPIKSKCGLGDSDYLDVVYTLRSDDGYNLQKNLEASASMLPDGFLPIGQDPFGNLICLVVSGEKSGWVYFWNRAGKEGDEPRDFPGFGEICPVANGFNEFIFSLRRDPEALS